MLQLSTRNLVNAAEVGGNLNSSQTVTSKVFQKSFCPHRITRFAFFGQNRHAFHVLRLNLARYFAPVSETLVVNEVYLSSQGESTFAGLPCVFVRLTACNLRCS